MTGPPKMFTGAYGTEDACAEHTNEISVFLFYFVFLLAST